MTQPSLIERYLRRQTRRWLMAYNDISVTNLTKQVLEAHKWRDAAERFIPEARLLDMVAAPTECPGSRRLPPLPVDQLNARGVLDALESYLQHEYPRVGYDMLGPYVLRQVLDVRAYPIPTEALTLDVRRQRANIANEKRRHLERMVAEHGQSYNPDGIWWLVPLSPAKEDVLGKGVSSV